MQRDLLAAAGRRRAAAGGGSGGAENTLLLMHFDASGYWREEVSGLDMTAWGAWSGATGKFGEAVKSATSPRANLALGDPSLFDFNVEEKTIDFWMQFAGSYAATLNFVDQNRVATFRVQTYSTYLYSYFNHTDGSATGWHGSTPANNALFHVAYERYADNINIYINGNLSSSRSIAGKPAFKTPLEAHIGSEANAAYAGTLDELRISKIARYQGVSFTPPTAPYEVD